MSHKIVSLFSGCGGLDYGFHTHGFQLAYAADNFQAAVKCFSYNFGFPAKQVDVSTPEFLNDLKELSNIDVVLGGFPCQGFSKAGPKKKDDPRNILYLSMLEAVKVLKPKIFVAENVDGMAQNFNGSFVDTILQDFQSIGYKVNYRILNAADFGVPQYRRRIFFVGILDKIETEFPWPKPTHFGGSRNGEFKTKWELFADDLFADVSLLPAVTIKDAIGDLANQEEGSISDHIIEPLDSDDLKIIKHIGAEQKLCNVRFAESSVYTWEIPEVFGQVTTGEISILETIGKNRRKKIYGDIPNGNPLAPSIISELLGRTIEISELEVLVQKGYLKEIKGKYDLKGAMFCSGLYKRPSWTMPSPTVITMFGEPRYFVHPTKDRAFTIRECARLQSFPDNFKFLESQIYINDAYKLIGNAVPPVLSEQIAKAVKQVLSLSRRDETQTLRPTFGRQTIRV